MKAIVLAAGEGERLRPLTATRPKPMLHIAGKPVLEHLISAIRASGIREIVLVVGYHRELIEKYFKDGKKWGIDLRYVYQERRLGTADAIGLTEKYINEDYFLVVYGDLYIQSHAVKSFIQKHLENASASIAVVQVKNPQDYGVVIHKDGLIQGIVEKPQKKEYGNIVNTGLYILPKAVFTEISETPASRRAEVEITDTIQLLLERGVTITSKEVDTRTWLDLGRPWDLLEANERVLENSRLEVKGTVERGTTIIGNVGIEEGARIRSGSYIEGPTIIGSGSDIGPNCYIRPFTSIGRDVRVGNACEVKASIIFDGTQIGHLSYIGDSIIGTNCNLGAGTITANLKFDESTVKVMIKSDLVDSSRRKLGAIIGDNVKTGVCVAIMPGVKLGPNAWIGPNLTVYRDIGEEVFIQEQNTRFFKSRKAKK